MKLHRVQAWVVCPKQTFPAKGFHTPIGLPQPTASLYHLRSREGPHNQSMTTLVKTACPGQPLSPVAERWHTRRVALFCLEETPSVALPSRGPQNPSLHVCVLGPPRLCPLDLLPNRMSLPLSLPHQSQQSLPHPTHQLWQLCARGRAAVWGYL